MTGNDAAVPLDELLAHRAWVRALAVALSRDENDADDLEQQAWLTAMRRPPETLDSPRGWLASVLRSMAKRRARTDSRRARREAGAARRDVDVNDPARLAARAEMHARVAMAVVALREPYRQAVLLHYFEGLSVRETSARMDAPFETSRARLRRGREQLRRQLDSEMGGMQPLGVALLPLLPRGAGRWGSTGVAAAATGGTLVMAKFVIGSVAVCVLAAGVLWATSDSDGPEVAAVPVVEDVVDRAPDPTPPRERVRVDQPTTTLGDDGDAVPDVEPEPTTVEQRLQLKLDDIHYRDVSMYDVLARISAQTSVSIHLQTELLEGARSSDEFTIGLQLDVPTEAQTTLNLLTTFRGLKLHIADDRVVVHRGDIEWSDGMASVEVTPKLPDPNAPTTLTVRGRVVDETGGGIEGAVILHASAEVARSAPGGHFEVELVKEFHSLTARISGRQRSKKFDVAGEYGDVLDAELVLGGAAGFVRVTVTSDSGDDPKHCYVRFNWNVPGTEQTLRDGREVALRDSETVLLGPAAGGFIATLDSLPPGELRLVVSAREHVKDVRTVTIVVGERTDVTVELHKADLAERLRTERMSVQFADAPLRDVTNYVRRTKSLNISVDPAFAAANADARVTVTAEDVTIESILDELCAAIPGATWVIRNRVVLITKGE